MRERRHPARKELLLLHEDVSLLEEIKEGSAGVGLSRTLIGKAGGVSTPFQFYTTVAAF